uniref:FLYWCH-type domain-containing protein n=1 Tax=Meloidogyne incognita TaxID=6306 RepID=A0A914NJW1_MELIC
MSSSDGEYSSNSANEMENPEPVQFLEVKSKRGASMLTRNGFEYAFEKVSLTINNVEYWKCPKRPPYCCGRIHTYSEWYENDGIRYKLGWIKNENHAHDADFNKIEIRNANPEKMIPEKPGENDQQHYGDGCDGWIRAWIEHEHLEQRNASFPIELWNLFGRINAGLSRTNNSIEGWHNAWGTLLDQRPLFSKFVRRMLKEFSRWDRIVTDYRNAPGNGIRGRGLKRNAVYLRQDTNLQQLVAEFENRVDDPVRYLRTISYHLAEN